MISWKDSFEKINNELDLARKKKGALEELSSNGRISQLTYESLNDALTVEIDQIEARRKELAEKMTSKLNELERQVNALETFLANVEMSYAAGEITEELHGQEVSALSLGLEATKNELNFIKEAIMQLVPEETQAELTPAVETAETEEPRPAETVLEPTPEESASASIEAQVETPPVTDEAGIEQSTEMIMETPETPDIPEVPIETPTDEITEETTEEAVFEEAALETPIEEAGSEEETLSEASTEEAISEEQVLSEISTEETVSEELALEAPTEEMLSETTEEIAEKTVPEEQLVAETPVEEDRPFPEEDWEE